tara:strand:+ start:1133 stop:1672 length:540 start_codon:yes stop_codon:yes gene_type:complete
MGILGFGRVTKLEDLKVNDLKKERITQEVRQDQLLVRIRHAAEEYDALIESASEPGLSDGEVDAAAYKMSQISKTKDRAEQDLQQILTRMTVIDSTLDLINQRAELEKKGIWKKINSIPEEELEAQLENLAVDRKESQININRIVEVFDVDRQAVQSQRSADFRRSRDAILQRKSQKDS